MDLPLFDLSLWTLPAALVLMMALGAAVVVLRTAAYRPLNRALAAVLALEALYIGLSAGWALMAEDPGLARALGLVGTTAGAVLPSAYLVFLGLALPTRLVAPFRDPRVVRLLAALAVAGVALVLARPRWFMTELYDPGWASWNFRYAPAGLALSRAVAFAALWGFISAVASVARTEPGSAARTSAFLFAAAFGVRDLYLGVMQALRTVVRPIEFWGDLLYNPGFGTAYLLYIALLAYGVLHAQMLQIELQLKFALTQSAAGAMLAGVFFLLSEILETVLPAQGALAGILAAGAVVLALLPLHRLARRIMDRLMSGVERSDDYLDARREEIYRAALESAVEDGVISPEERRILARLQAKLELEPTATARLEREYGHEAPGSPPAAAPPGPDLTQ